MTLPSEWSSLIGELHQRAAKIRQPVNGTFELTARCNLACRMCYVCHPAGDRRQSARELPASAWVDLARQAADNGMVFLLLTGGEVFVRQDFFEIYEPLSRMGLMLTIFTNGTLVTDEVARKLKQCPPSRTEITLYGATAATYEAVTGVPGSFARCLDGIEALVKHGVPLALKSTLTRQNVGELEAMRQLSRGWGLPFFGAWLLTGRPDRAPSAVDECRLSARECIDLEATDKASASDWMETALRQAGEPNRESFYCYAGKAAFTINPAGEMNACLDSALPAARVRELGFAAAWRQVQEFVDNAPPATVCAACAVREYCPWCPPWSMMENGTLTEPVPYLCEVAYARKERYQNLLLPKSERSEERR